MLKFYNSGILLITLALLTSCKNEEGAYTAYFSGTISNPSTPYVILSRGNQVIDTLQLDEKNHFFKKFDSLTPGLYSFKLEPDYQYVFIDKNDSLDVTLDAVNFDKSISFEGRGSKKNNFMMQQYLLNEKDNRTLHVKYNNDNTFFQKTADAIYKNQKEYYSKEKKQIKWGKDFDFYAKARIDLEYYTSQELYPYLHNLNTGENVVPSKSYYDFRKQIDFNDSRLVYFSPFTRYLNAMLVNMASAKKYDANAPKDKSLRENIEKLRIADSLFTNKTTKNVVLDNIAFAYILEDRNIVNNEKFLDEYTKLSTEKDNDNDIKKMGRAIKLLKPGREIPAVTLVDTKNKPFTISKDLTRQTVIFFWTACATMQLDIMHQKIKTLKKQHPDVSFLAVNIDDEDQWKRMTNEYHFRGTHPLHAKNFDELKYKWVFTKINRTIILNQDGTIKNAFTNLMDDKFSDYLK